MNFVFPKNHFTRIANLSLVLLCLTLMMEHSCFGQSGSRSRPSSSDPYFSAESQQPSSKEKTASKVSDDPATQAILAKLGQSNALKSKTTSRVTARLASQINKL